MTKFQIFLIYNRCSSRGHIVLSLAIHRLHLEQFFEHNDSHENSIDELYSRKNDDPKIVSNTYVKKYVTNMKETMAGSHGKTAQLCIYYAYLMKMYLILHRAMKMNNTQLFAYVLYRIGSI